MSDYPTEMNSVFYTGPEKFEIRRVPVPKISDDEILLKVTLCGVCGTDQHIHEGEFMSKFPLIPGHEAVGVIHAVGKNVKGLNVGDHAAADVCNSCQDLGLTMCHYCKRGEPLFCENFSAKGVAMDGGFAEYVTYNQSKVFKYSNISDEEATLLEPASCAIHGLDKLKPKVGAEVLLLGAGPTGLCMAQLLKLNGAAKVVIAANDGMKMDIAEKLNCGDEYVRLKRGGGEDTEAQWKKIKEDYPHGFDCVIECTGVESLVDRSIDFVRRGGSLMVYGVYANKARVHWSPTKIFSDEINIIGSFSQFYCFGRAVQYLDSGKLNVKGMVTNVFDLKDFGKALECMNGRQALKIAIRPHP